jgi:hypothetical protein
VEAGGAAERIAAKRLVDSAVAREGISMIRVFLALAVIWAILLPPFFTDGACTAEFNTVSRQIQDNKAAFASPSSALKYWQSQNVPVQVITSERCHRSRPRFVDVCGPGDLLYLGVPIQNKVCHYYRDSSVRVQFQYDDQGRLRGYEAAMDPYKYFHIPWLGINWYWGK